jgi:uncharacterized protein YciU (UPF0263 family)
MKYQILQVRDDAENSRYIMFSSLEMVEHLGLKITKDLYEKVWEGEIEEANDVYVTLEQIFHQFNIGRKPEGFKGHSLSVSDIIKLEDKFYYCDSFGFEEIEL